MQYSKQKHYIRQQKGKLIMFDIEEQIRSWKAHIHATSSIDNNEVKNLESLLRDTITELSGQGVNEEEAFLVAIRRLGDSEIIEKEFAKISTEELCHQLYMPLNTSMTQKTERKELVVILALTLFGGLLSKIPALFGFGDFDTYDLLYLKNASLFAFTPVAMYFLYKRKIPLSKTLLAIAFFPLAALLVNIYPYQEPYHTAILTIIHLPILSLIFLVPLYGGSAKGTGWKSPKTRLDFIRFIGEAFVYAVLIGMGGMVLILLTLGTFELIKVDASPFVVYWMGPFGLFGLFTVAAYLVDQKKSLMGGIAPVLARIFTPLFSLVLVSLIIAFLTSPNQASENRSMLIWFDVILAFVLALTLYSMCSSEQKKNTSRFPLWDVMTFVLIICAVLVDLIALWGILARLQTFGFSANRTAALGENLLLLSNLIFLAIGYSRYMAKNMSFSRIVELQMRFLPLYGIWAAVVVILFPLLFGFR
ncbi:MAG: hypothetical protein JEY71_08720 [Sphaerochaeta sp.]|nr:hypothetical protein [Sphaerochaeta sp.]